jgi:hypothetical protein
MYDPGRRNRNIGTPRQGYGQDNRMRIPDSWWNSKIFYERLNNPTIVKREIHSKEFSILIEPTLSDFTHSCTIDDICTILKWLPANDVINLDTIVLRQPKRKEVILSTVWGRLAFYYKAFASERPAIILEAQRVDQPLKWSKSLSPFSKKELMSLEKDGHRIEWSKKSIKINSTLESCRATQLYRTIPHELGHYVDYQNADSRDLYFSKSYRDREAFAHRYADEFRAKMIEKKKIPFKRILEKDSFIKDSLEMGWFIP